MTVCIAALCVRDKSIVAISDSMLSMSDMSADKLAIKFSAIGSNWIAMFAGNDVSPVVPILKEVSAALQEQGAPENLEDVVKVLQAAFRKQIVQKAESTILVRFNIDMAEFRREGLNNFGSELFTRLVYEVEQITLDLTFLVFGFEDKEAHIFTVQGRGEVLYYDIPGFWAIGSGQTSALGSLFAPQRSVIYGPIDSVLSKLSKAKFSAESALGVGQQTTALVIKADGSRYLIDSAKMDKVKEAWMASRPPDIPTNLQDAAAKALEEAKKEED